MDWYAKNDPNSVVEPDLNPEQSMFFKTPMNLAKMQLNHHLTFSVNESDVSNDFRFGFSSRF